MSLIKYGAALKRGLLVLLIMLAGIADMQLAHAEYGDIVINNYSDAAGMRPARRDRSTEPSVCPDRTSTPPRRARKGNT